MRSETWLIKWELGGGKRKEEKPFQCGIGRGSRPSTVGWFFQLMGSHHLLHCSPFYTIFYCPPYPPPPPPPTSFSIFSHWFRKRERERERERAKGTTYVKCQVASSWWVWCEFGNWNSLNIAFSKKPHKYHDLIGLWSRQTCLNVKSNVNVYNTLLLRIRLSCRSWIVKSILK